MAGIILSIIFGAATMVFAALYFHNRHEIRRLTQAVDSYLAGGKASDISLRDTELSALQNSVAELENNLNLAHEQTKKEAKRSTDLLTDISHQLKTPLASLRLFLELDTGVHLEEELTQVDRMEHLIYSLLRLERMCNDGYTFHFEQHSLQSLVVDSWQELRVHFPQKQFDISGNADLRCDEIWLSEAISNILKNDCEHTAADGSIRVRISETEQEICMEIEDNGGGVSEDELPRLFERFYGRQDSAGIGLNITKEIVWRHHGTIHAENTENGLCFSLYFPKLEQNLAKS